MPKSSVEVDALNVTTSPPKRLPTPVAPPGTARCLDCSTTSRVPASAGFGDMVKRAVGAWSTGWGSSPGPWVGCMARALAGSAARVSAVTTAVRMDLLNIGCLLRRVGVWRHGRRERPREKSRVRRSLCQVRDSPIRVRGPGELADQLAARRHDQPIAAELGHVLAEDLAGLRLAAVVVERSAAVGDLVVLLAPQDAAEQLRSRAAPSAQPAGRVERRPGVRAVAEARTRAAAVLRERVERVAAAVDEDRAVARAAGPYGA